MSREFNQDIHLLTREMVRCVTSDSPFSSVSSPFIPNRHKVIELVNDLRSLLFPRQYAGREVFNCTIDYYIGNLMLKIENNLRKEIGVALMRKEDSQSYTVTQEVADEAVRISIDFMKKLPHIHNKLSKDVEAFYQGDPAAQSKDEIVLSYPGLLAIMVYRLAHELYKEDIPIIPRMMTEYAHSLTGVDINPGATIGDYFFIDHATGVVIGETCQIANNVKIYQGVTLGALSTRGGQDLTGVKRHPTIEDNVTIYANATVLGGNTVIGKDAIIGGSCFITESIPAGARVQTVSEIKMH